MLDSQLDREIGSTLQVLKRSKIPPSTVSDTAGLVKNQLSDQLRSEILNGSLKPGERIVEGKWAAEFGVAQASIREAINILAQAGFVTKVPGRSARVINLTRTDVGHIYRLRGVIEGLAARLAARSPQDLNTLQATMNAMRKSAISGDREGLIDCDLQYHLALCELSRNPYLIQHARRILVPLFAFVRMRVSASGQSASAWRKDLEAHQTIIDLIREGEGEVAEQYVRSAIERFAKTAYDYWEKREHAE
jgi:DNA-binding GntR family transcriptional regulator